MNTLNSFLESIQKTPYEPITVKTVLGQTYEGKFIKFDQKNRIIVLEKNNSDTSQTVSLFLDHVVVIE